MQTFKNWLIGRLLKKDKLVAVPESWQTDYVKTASANVSNRNALISIIKEYNNLLKDYFEKCSIKELTNTLTEEKVEIKTGLSKAELVDLAVKEFSMSYEQN